jgi:hypothetical protein
MDRLEKAVSESAKDLVALKSEVATLVGATADIRKRIGRASPPVIAPSSPAQRQRRSSLQAVTAIAGIVLGIAAGAWFWLNTGNEPLAPAAPIAIASEPSPPLQPPQDAPVSQPVIVPAAAITPVRDTPVHASSPRVEYQPVKYVGTLSIDSDPGGDVFIDRKPVGKTPIRAENLKAGSHLVWIERDGYHRFTRVVLVPADRVSRLFADLEPESR